MSDRIWGLPLVAADYLEDDGPPVVRRRTWRERLLGLPWRPWRATATVVPRIPRRNAVLAGDRILVHPTVLEELRNIQKRQDEKQN